MAPTDLIADAVGTAEFATVITSSPFLIPKDFRAIISASVPLPTAVTFLKLYILEKFFSNFFNSSPKNISPLDMIAMNVSGAGVLMGNKINNWQNIDLPNSKCQLMIDGQTIGTGYGKDVDGHPILPIIWLAKKLSDQGNYLKAGDIVVTGSMLPPTFLGNRDATGQSSAILTMDKLGQVILNFK